MASSATSIRRSTMDRSNLDQRRLHTAPSLPSSSSGLPCLERYTQTTASGDESDDRFAYNRAVLESDSLRSTSARWDYDWDQEQRSYSSGGGSTGFNSGPSAMPQHGYSLSSTSNRMEHNTAVPRTGEHHLGLSMSLGPSSDTHRRDIATRSMDPSHYLTTSPTSPPRQPLRRATSDSDTPRTSLPSMARGPHVHRSYSTPSTPNLNPTFTSSLRGFSKLREEDKGPIASTQSRDELVQHLCHFGDYHCDNQGQYPEAYSTPDTSLSTSYASWTFPTYSTNTTSSQDPNYDASEPDGRKRRKTSPTMRYQLEQVPFQEEHRWGNAPTAPVSDLDYLPLAPPPLAPFNPNIYPAQPLPPFDTSPTGSHRSLAHSDHSDIDAHHTPPSRTTSIIHSARSGDAPRPPPVDFELTGDMVPQPQSIRFDDDMYRPSWVRGNGHTKEGWCKLCPDGGSWFQLRTSAYWYHLQFVHGVSAATGHQFPSPLETRIAQSGDRTEGLCHGCGKFTLYYNHRHGTTAFQNPAPWFRHTYTCLKKLYKSGGSSVLAAAK